MTNVSRLEKRLTAHGSVYAPDVDKKRYHGEVLGKCIGLYQLVSESFGGLGGIKQSFDVQFVEGQLGCYGVDGVGPWIREYWLVVREDAMEKVILKVGASEGLAFAPFYGNEPAT